MTFSRKTDSQTAIFSWWITSSISYHRKAHLRRQFLPSLRQSPIISLVTLIRDIGEWLGFVSATEQKIAKGTTVDVVWSWRIGNVGEVKYVFEVQKGGNEKSALFNLLKALSDPSVQRVVVISDKEQLDT